MNDYITTFKKVLTYDEQKINANAIAWRLLDRGWSLNAICGALGNWQSECTLNPNLPQNPNYPTALTGGFGLPQWTDWGYKYLPWCIDNGIDTVGADNNPAAILENQFDFHDYDAIVNNSWFANQGYNYSWDEYKASEDDVDVLATAYYWEYERSGSADPGSRPQNAIDWWVYFGMFPPKKPFLIWIIANRPIKNRYRRW